MSTADYCNCGANGCPMLGTMSRSTTGVKEDGAPWLCFIHFGAEGKRWPQITAELQRLAWLVDITRNIRARRYDEKAAAKEIALNQSKHLLKGNQESLAGYLARLETVLQQACAAPAPETPPLFNQEE